MTEISILPRSPHPLPILMENSDRLYPLPILMENSDRLYPLPILMENSDRPGDKKPGF